MVKRRLRLELAGAASPEDVARKVRKRLATIARARSCVDWDKQRTLVADLEAQRRAIRDHVASSEPDRAAGRRSERASSVGRHALSGDGFTVAARL